MRDASHGVQRVHEREAARIRVQRVGPTPVRRARAATAQPCITQLFCVLSAIRPAGARAHSGRTRARCSAACPAPTCAGSDRASTRRARARRTRTSPSSTIWSRTPRSDVRSKTNCVVFAEPMLCRTKVLPSRNMPPPGPLDVNIGTPNEPVTFCDMSDRPVLRLVRADERRLARSACDEADRAVVRGRLARLEGRTGPDTQRRQPTRPRALPGR